ALAHTALYTLSLHDALPISETVEARIAGRHESVNLDQGVGALGMFAGRGESAGEAEPRQRRDDAAAADAGRVFSRDQSAVPAGLDRKSTRLNSSHDQISYAV